MAFGRDLCLCQHSFKYNSLNCYLCGIRKLDNQAIKTTGYISPIHTNMKFYFNQMKRRTTQIIEDAKQINESTYFLLSSICQKFSFGLQTLALGLYIYQCVKHMHCGQKFLASSCLIIASKAMQLDKNVPYLNRFQRYADKDHSQEQYQNSQRSIFQAMNFNLQYSTFLTYINYYLTSGVIYSSDDLNKSLVQYFQDDAIIKAKQYLRKGNFSQFDQEKLALNIIKDTRKKYNLKEWCEELTNLTGYKSEQISLNSTVKKIQQQEFKGLKPLQVKKLQTNQIQAYRSIQKPQKIVDLKNICIRKNSQDSNFSKNLIKDRRTNSSMKQNTFLSSIYQTNQNSIPYLSSKTKPFNQVSSISMSTQFMSSKNVLNNLAIKRR